MRCFSQKHKTNSPLLRRHHNFSSQWLQKVWKLRHGLRKKYDEQSWGNRKMRRIKSPECLGADLPKERNLRAFPSSSSADCRLAATWLKRWKAQECCETQVPAAQDAPFLFTRKVLMQQFVFGATRHSPAHTHAKWMRARLLKWNQKLGRGKNRASSSLHAWCSLSKNARELRYLKASAADVRRAINYSAQTTAGEAHKKRHRSPFASGGLTHARATDSKFTAPEIRRCFCEMRKWASSLVVLQMTVVVWGACKLISFALEQQTLQG